MDGGSRPPSIGTSKTDLCPEQITFVEGGPWRGRTTLEKCLIVFLVLLVIAAIIFLVLFLVFFIKDKEEPVLQDTLIQTTTEDGRMTQMSTTHAETQTTTDTLIQTTTEDGRMTQMSTTPGETRATTVSTPKPPDTCTTFSCLETASYVAQRLNESVDPCDDFYEFACGNWIKRNPLTPAVSSINNFYILHQELMTYMRDLLGKKDPDAIEAFQKARAFYSSCENTRAMDAKGTQPLLDLLKTGGSNLFPTLEPNWVDENMTLNQILARVREVGGLGFSPFIAMGVGTDEKQSMRHIIYFGQPGLGLSTRTYYLGNRNSMRLLLYQKLYADLMVLLGANSTTATQDAIAMVDFEIEIAKVLMPRASRSNREKLYNNMTVQQLTEKYPQFDWLEYLQGHFSTVGINITMDEEVVVSATPYYDKIFDVINSTSRRTVLNYCLWSYVFPFSSLLDAETRDTRSAFSRALSGTTRNPERWETCVSFTDNLFKSATGRLYVENHFSPSAKKKIDIMIGDLKAAFKEMIIETDWMTNQTKIAALEKLEAVVDKIGYPVADMNDTYLNAKVKDLNITEGEFFENNMNIRRHGRRKSLENLRLPVNRNEWLFSAAIVNAFYRPVTNSIFFPAAILQRPFFSVKFLNAMNYGAIGFVIGHEITHGFDTTGRSYDKIGNLRMWWQAEDLVKFLNRTQCIMEQYSNFVEPVVNKTVNGKLTLGEDIADNGGMKQAYRAYRRLVEKMGKEELKLPVLKYTPDQLFFISGAQVWCGNMRKELRELYLALDYHSPNRFRAIGPMQNNPDFARVFNCPVGSYMNPVKKCHVW